jgi:hypothetical protein
MFALTDLAVAFAAGGLAVGLVVWLAMRISRLEQENADLKRRQQDGPAWSQEMKLNHRQQLVSIAALNQLAARDLLDVLMRVSPDMAREIIEEIAPHLIQKENIK